MIYEFRNPMPVETPVGYGMLVYVRDGGVFSNDVFAIVSEVDGKLRHFRSGQLDFYQTLLSILKTQVTFKKTKINNLKEK